MHGNESFGSVVDADALRAHISDPGWRLVDCRHDLLNPEAGLQAYRQGHLKGAVFAHLDRDLSGPRCAETGRHPLPSPAQVLERLRLWGIGDATQVVAYDAGHGSFAGRLWWLARWVGHRRVAVLDGGWQAALQAGIPVEAGEAHFAAAAHRAVAVSMPTVLAAEVEQLRRSPDWLLVDARAPDRYEGRNETIDPVAGHIPGAVNRFWQHNLQPDGRFKPPEQLRAEFLALLKGRSADRMVVQCGSGVTACHHLVALERAGLDGAALYAGSWSEWIADSDRPVATGPAA